MSQIIINLPQEENYTKNIFNLPKDILILIFQFLIGNENTEIFNLQDFFNFSVSCKFIYEISENKYLWRFLLQNKLFLKKFTTYEVTLQNKSKFNEFFHYERKEINLQNCLQNNLQNKLLTKSDFLKFYKQLQNYKKYKILKYNLFSKFNDNNLYETENKNLKFYFKSIGGTLLLFILPILLFGLFLDELIIPTFYNYILIYLSTLPSILYFLISHILLFLQIGHFPILSFLIKLSLNFTKKIKKFKTTNNYSLLNEEDKQIYFEFNYFKLYLKYYFLKSDFKYAKAQITIFTMFSSILFQPILFFMLLGFKFIYFFENAYFIYFTTIPMILGLIVLNFNIFYYVNQMGDYLSFKKKCFYFIINFFIFTISTVLFGLQIIFTSLGATSIYFLNYSWTMSFIFIYFFTIYIFIIKLISTFAICKNTHQKYKLFLLDFIILLLLLLLNSIFILIGLKLDGILIITLYSYLFIVPNISLLSFSCVLLFFSFVL